MEKVEQFVSFDGIEFDTASKCQKYEGSKFAGLIKELNSSIIKRVKALDIFTVLSDIPYIYNEPFNQYYILVPRTRHDVFVLNQILKLAGNNKEQVTANDCFTMLILAVNVYSDNLGVSHIIRLGDIVKNLSNNDFEVISNIKNNEKLPVESGAVKPVKDIAEK